MHPRVQRGGLSCGAGSADGISEDDFDELLRQQAEFSKSRQDSGVKVVRGARPVDPEPELPAQPSIQGSLGASEDGGKGERVGKKRAPSLFKQLRQGLDAQGETKPFGVPTSLPHPEITALPDVEAECESLPCLADTVKENFTARPSASKEHDVSVGVLDAPAAGFPTPAHRSVSKFLGRSQQRVGENISDVGPFKSKEGRLTEEEEIDEQNRNAISEASLQEIHEWQQQLVKQLGQDTCEFLKKRGLAKLQQQGRAVAKKEPNNPTSKLPSVPEEVGGEDTATESKHVEEDGVDGSSGDQKKDKADKTANPEIIRLGLTLYSDRENPEQSNGTSSISPGIIDPAQAFQSLAGGCLDRGEMQKLQWTMPSGEPDVDAIVADESLPPEAAGKVIQLLRYDFSGSVCLRDVGGSEPKSSEIGVSEGLHHHGAESSQAGYTLAELLILSRSTNMPQRALSLRILVAVLEQSRKPVCRHDLSWDPALRKAGELPEERPENSDRQNNAAGFGMGLCVFFWHGIARGDVAKHLAEALSDPALPVQVSALRGINAFFDGRVGEPWGCNKPRPGVIRGHACGEAEVSVVEYATGSSFHGARELIWPDAPPPNSAILARRPRVAVMTTEESGAGGGTSSWRYLLRRCLLGAKEESEVTAADVLDPFLASKSRNDEVAPWVPIVDGVSQCIAPLGDDPELLAVALRSLGAAAIWSAPLCHRMLQANTDRRSKWLGFAADTTCHQDNQTLRIEVLRLMRCSSEVGGRAAADWWLASPGPVSEDSPSRWTAEATVRCAVLDAIASDRFEPPVRGNGTSPGPRAKFCALQGVHVWLAWLQSRAGVDSIGSFTPAIAVYWHRMALASRGDATDTDFECDWLLVASTLRLATGLAKACEDIRKHPESWSENVVEPLQSVAEAACPSEGCAVEGGILVAAAAEAALPLVHRLARSSSREGASAAEQLALAALAELIASARNVEKLTVAGRELLALLSKGDLAALVVPPSPEGASDAGKAFADDDEEAPWPFGGAIDGARIYRLARLKVLRGLCDLATRLEEKSAMAWLRSIHKAAADRVKEISGKTLSDEETSCLEALTGATQQDPWSALFGAVSRALSKCGGVDVSGDLAPIASRALQIAGCWPTARLIFESVSVSFGSAAEEAITRCAFRPDAPWVAVRKDIGARRARATGHVPTMTRNQVIQVPSAMGPPSLAFAPAAFWALACAPPPEAAKELLEVLSRPGAETLADASPPWLPFIAFISLLGTPLGPTQLPSEDSNVDDGCVRWAWSDPRTKNLLAPFADRHFKHKNPSNWLNFRGAWLTETLRGLCDRLSIVFLEESFGNLLVARALWSFAAGAMPQECREVCWGSQDPAVPALLAKVLRVGENAVSEPLFWPLDCYLGPEPESVELLTTAAAALEGVPNKSWLGVMMAHHQSLHKGEASTLMVENNVGRNADVQGPVQTSSSSLNEME